MMALLLPGVSSDITLNIWDNEPAYYDVNEAQNVNGSSTVVNNSVNNSNSTLTTITSAPLQPPPASTSPQSASTTECLHDRPVTLEDPAAHRVYTVGVLAIRGPEAAYEEFNKTYDYLTATAGQRFDPPLQFRLKPLNFIQLFEDTEQQLVDFIYVNPSAFSCIESEFTARTLVSQMSRRKVYGNVYDLKKFGGVIMARADNAKVNTIFDVKDKIVAAASIAGLGSGQMQFLEMQNAGMSYINDPKQLVFTSNQGKVVNGVLKGDFDVGFVRTDQIERSKDANGTLLDPNLFKIIDPKPNLTIDGVPFPFQSSTPLYPEWNLAALRHVPPLVAQVVQDAMLALADHSTVAIQREGCMEEHNNTMTCDWSQMTLQRCDTTPEVATLALEARNNGKYASWQTTLSYMQLRSMQEVTGFIQRDPADNVWKCIRPTTVYESIVCPSGYYKQSEEEVNQACAKQGLSCGTEEAPFQCICSPCRKILTCNNAVKVGDECVPYKVLLPSILVPFFFLCAIAVHYYVEYRRKQADSVWAVQPSELKFEEPSKVIGRGTFGLVLLAEYRGTQVAVKKVLPPRTSIDSKPFHKVKGFLRRWKILRPGSSKKANHDRVQRDPPSNLTDGNSRTFSKAFNTDESGQGNGHTISKAFNIVGKSDNYDLESGAFVASTKVNGTSLTNDASESTHDKERSPAELLHLPSPGMRSLGVDAQWDTSIDKSLKHLGLGLGYRSSGSNPGLKSMASRLTSFTTNSSCGDNSKKTYEQLKTEFVVEMRHLAKLRHPCITTVMGAVVSKASEPMLVMEYMSRGSLHDVLMDTQTELDVEDHIMPILVDITQGVRFLHAANPQVIHGDLKAKNVLIDANYRAKVTDFGLSAKQKDSASGTPYWMAPELLRRESVNNSKTDMYSFGILIYEIFSRRNPYEGEPFGEVLKQVCNPLVNKRPPVPENCSIKIAELMSLCLSAKASQRPTAEQVDLALRVEGSVKERVSKLEKLNQELAAANKKIAEASSMQLEHFACMSHEIRTPLNCIVGLSSLMEDTGLTPSQKESINMIYSSSLLLQSIVDDVLDYSKLQSGNAEVDIKPTEIQEVVTALVTAMRNSIIAKKRNVTVHAQFSPDVCRTVNTDGRRLTQILFNLVSNAVKFSKDNGVVEVGINICERVEPFSKPGPEKEDDNTREQKQPGGKKRRASVCFARQVLRVTVKDFGKGIDQKNFATIFQPFTQTNSGISNIDGGTGLGLAITEKLIRALGGDISVDSRLGEWTEFTVDLPYDEPPARSSIDKSKFQKATFCYVGEDKHVENIFKYFRVPLTMNSTMAELETALPKESLQGGEMAQICLVQSNLFDPDLADRLARLRAAKFVVLGPCDAVKDTVLHYPYWSEMVPLVLMEKLAEHIQKVLAATQSKPLHVENSEPGSGADADCDLSKLRVLCAEDNLVNQKILVRMLKRIGVAQVEVVENGQLAVEKEASTEFDLVLMDMQMPIMGGVDATKLIVKRKGGHPVPPVVFATAHVSAAFENECYEAGGSAYLPKPYTFPVLKKTLSEVAAKRVVGEVA